MQNLRNLFNSMMMKPEKDSLTKAPATSGIPNNTPTKSKPSPVFQRSRRSSSFNGLSRFSTGINRCDSTNSFTGSTDSNGAAAGIVDKKRSNSYKRRRNSESDKKTKGTRWKLPTLHRTDSSVMTVRVKINNEMDHSSTVSGESLEASLSMSGHFTTRVSSQFFSSCSRVSP